MIRTTIVELMLPAAASNGARLFTSLEGQNSGGSIKDRMVLGELTDLMERGTLKRGDWVGEVSLGSTARSLSFYANYLELRCVVFVPDFLAADEIDDMKKLGAEVHAVPVNEAFQRYDIFCTERGVHPFEQLKDVGKRRFYSELGRFAALEAGKIDIVIGPVGTGHSLLGVADGIRPAPRVYTAEPADGHVAGIRNIQTTRHGPEDPCDPSIFDRRVVISEDKYFPESTLQSSQGLVSVTDSFRVALGAALCLSDELRGKSIFLVGAANRLLDPLS